jgi:hypothetical protein
MKASLLMILLALVYGPLVIAKSGYSQASENITAQVVPQGTSIEETGNKSTEK